MRIFGVILLLLGLVLTLTVIGGFIGFPLMIVGAILAAFGGKKVVIQNITQNTPQDEKKD